MPPKKTTDTEAPNGLSAGELRFIKVMFDNMTQKPDANWDKVAEDLGLKDSKCAKERYRQMSVRHGWNVGGSAKSSPNGKAKCNPLGVTGDGKVTKKRPPVPKKNKMAEGLLGDNEWEEADKVKTEVKEEEKEDFADEN